MSTMSDGDFRSTEKSVTMDRDDELRIELDGTVLRDGLKVLEGEIVDAALMRRRALDATSGRLDDPARWRLRRSRVRLLRVTLTGPAAEITLNEGGRKAIEVARWASRRGHRTQIAPEDLLWGLLADASSESVRILRRGQVDLGRLWTDLRRWHQSA